MLDINRFINSKDIAAYLREIGYEFNAMEAAYLVDLCDDATLDERVEAWREIIETMPDCPMTWNHNVEKRESTHEFLREYIGLQRRMLDMFEEGDGCVFFLSECRYSKAPNWLIREDGDLWTEEWPRPFSTLKKCVDHLRAEYASDEDFEFDRYVIAKEKIDFAGESWERREHIVLDGKLRPMSVQVGGLDERDSELAWHLSRSFLRMPIPFMRGDIVIDLTDRKPHPFVFEYLKFWDYAEMLDHGCEPLLLEEAKRWNDGVARRDERNGWDDSEMVACGYELSAHCDTSTLHDPCDLFFDSFGACGNYLNLERYTGPFDGDLRALEIISEYMKGKIGIEGLVNFSRLASLERHVSKLERSYDIEYTPAVRHLYKGARL